MNRINRLMSLRKQNSVTPSAYRGVLSLLFLLVGLESRAAATLEPILDAIHPEVKKWATVTRVVSPTDRPAFQTYHYRDSQHSVAFWPASTIKLYTVIATIEWLNTQNLPLESTITFSRQNAEGAWIQDCARTVPEMISEVFRRSSNEDYTLLLRTVGIDAINTHFLIPSKGFPHSALMRDYVTHRPVVYENTEPQRIQVTTAGGDVRQFSHQWSEISYAAQRGATALSSTTGNCTSTAELAQCLLRVLFHTSLPSNERFNLTADQANLICYGDPERKLIGLENRLAGPYVWEQAAERVFPQARYFHKAGLISSYVLDLAYVSDPDSDNHLILALAARTGDEQVIRDMAYALLVAARERRL